MSTTDHTNQTGGTNLRKRTAAILAVVLTATILAGGTYAWQSLNQAARNNAKGLTGPVGGRLHDDYEVMGEDFGKNEWTNEAEANKDIYVENYETAADDGRDIFVRVKLYEYMEIGTGATEEPFLADGSTPNPAYAARTAEPVIIGTDRDDVTKWTPRLPDDVDTTNTTEPSDAFRAYWTWNMGGQKTYMPTFNRDNHSNETDIKGDAIDPGALDTGEVMNTTNPGGSAEYDADAGLQDYFETETTHDAQEKYWDPEANSNVGAHALATVGSTHTSKLSETATVISMADWKALPAADQRGNYWVLDTDGWCYWANHIFPETATGLLLDSIEFNNQPEEEWYYSIYVKSQMATADDWTGAANGFYVNDAEKPSTDAENLMNLITAPLSSLQSIDMENVAAVAANGTLIMALNFDIAHAEAPDAAKWEAVTWSIAPDPSGASDVADRFDEATGVFTPSTADADQWFLVEAVSDLDPTIKAQSRIYVPADGKGVVTQMVDGINLYFVDHGDNTYQQVNEDGTLGNRVCPTTTGEPGGADDRTVVTIEGVSYIDEGDNRHYIAAGTDNTFGTSDDVPMYQANDDSMQPSKTILTVMPNPVSVARGKTVSLTVSATFEEESVDVSGVTWSLEGGGYAAGTTITPTGETVTLTVATDEPSTAINVRASYPGDHTASKDIAVDIELAENVNNGGIFYDASGEEWQVLTTDTNGNKLVMITTIADPNKEVQYNTTPVWTEYTESSLMSALQSFYNNAIGSDIKAAAVPVIIDDTRETVGTPAWSDIEILERDLSKAGTGTPTVENAIFILSVSEYNTYKSNIAVGQGSYWLRTPGYSSDYSASYLNEYMSSDIVYYIASTHPGVRYRPALWIKA